MSQGRRRPPPRFFPFLRRELRVGRRGGISEARHEEKRGARGFSEHIANTVARLKGKTERVEMLKFLNIEDPIEIQRNLNFALNAVTGREIQDAIRAAHSLLSDAPGGPGGPGLLSTLLRQEPQAQGGTAAPSSSPPLAELAHAWLKGCLAPQALDGEDGEAWPCRCNRCGLFFESFMPKHEHEFFRKCRIRPPPFRCPVCRKGFANNRSIEEHQKATGHEGEPLRPGPSPRARPRMRSSGPRGVGRPSQPCGSLPQGTAPARTRVEDRGRDAYEQ